MKKSKTRDFRIRIRVYAGNRMLGPGKMELLGHISDRGSLRAAAAEMQMSYMRAWTLVKDLNKNRKLPMVKMTRGGAQGETAKVTAFGKKVLELYRKMDAESKRAALPYGRRLVRLLG